MIRPPKIGKAEIEHNVRLKKNEKRDEFAKEIVKSLITSNQELTPKEIAEKTYCIAEEMITSRENYL